MIFPTSPRAKIIRFIRAISVQNNLFMFEKIPTSVKSASSVFRNNIQSLEIIEVDHLFRLLLLFLSFHL